MSDKILKGDKKKKIEGKDMTKPTDKTPKKKKVQGTSDGYMSRSE